MSFRKENMITADNGRAPGTQKERKYRFDKFLTFLLYGGGILVLIVGLAAILGVSLLFHLH